MTKQKTTKSSIFQFKQFALNQEKCSMKIGTDGVLLGAWVNCEEKKEILDIGCGTGLIGIMLGQRNKKGHIDGIEIQNEAFDEANENMNLAPWSDRLHCISGAIQEYSRASYKKYDLIVSNPPFFTGGTFSDQAGRDTARHTIKLPHGDLIFSIRRLLAKDGTFALILPYMEGLRFMELAERADLHVQRITEVFPKASLAINRLMIEFGWEKKDAPLPTQLVIREEDNSYTEAYIELTKDFYLKF